MSIAVKIKKMIRKFNQLGNDFPHLDANVLTVRNLTLLNKAMGWQNLPVVEGEHLKDFQYLEDLNDRRFRDAEVVSTACCNGSPQVILEIGTSHGRTTALIARNAPNAKVYTVNIPPEEMADGGIYTTISLSREHIGAYYRQQGCTNVHQIYANTRDWEPDFSPIDVVFIDGCHDSDFVYNDTRKALRSCRPGSIIIWHDFAPHLVKVYPWIHDVCMGVERLFREGLISGRILHLQDSWTGLYQVQEKRA